MAEHQDLAHIDLPTPGAFALTKLGKPEHLAALRQGRLRFTQLEYYKQVEGPRAVYQDPHEGLAAVYQATKTEVLLTLGGKQFVLNSENGLVGEVVVDLDEPDHILCLHAIYARVALGPDPTDEELAAAYAIPSSMRGFGSHIWLITNPAELTSRIKKAALASGVRCRAGLVAYVDTTRSHGSLPARLSSFVKLNAFADEREFRYAVTLPQPQEGPYLLETGSLEDISLVVTWDEFVENFVVRRGAGKKR